MDSEDKAIGLVIVAAFVSALSAGVGCYALESKRDITALQHGYCQTTVTGSEKVVWVKCP